MQRSAYKTARGVYDHSGLRSERIKILRGIFGNSEGTLEGIKYRESRHICLTNISLMTALGLVAFNVVLQSFCNNRYIILPPTSFQFRIPHLICVKIIEAVATRCQILGLKCTKFNFG